jgi:hypothetical protein
MPGARRHSLPGYARHITHRCRKKEFLFKLTGAAVRRGDQLKFADEGKLEARPLELLLVR